MRCTRGCTRTDAVRVWWFHNDWPEIVRYDHACCPEHLPAFLALPGITVLGTGDDDPRPPQKRKRS